MRELRKQIGTFEATINEARAAIPGAEEKALIAEKELTAAQERAAEGKGIFEGDLMELQQAAHSANLALQSYRDGETSLVESLSDLKSRLAEAEAERETIIKLLESQLSAAEQTLDTQRELYANNKTLFDSGLAAPDEVLKARQTVEVSRAEIEQLHLLLDYYHTLGQPTESSEKNPKGSGQENNTPSSAQATD